MIKFKTTTKMFYEPNPYKEDTRAWHVFIDICCIYNSGATIDINTLCKEYDQKPEYYQDILLLLVEDNYLEILK